MFALFLTKEGRYFHKKLSGVQKMIWDLEFKRFKTREIREEIRAEYDNAKSRLEPLAAQIESATDEEAKKALQEQYDAINGDAERFIAQMKGLDVEIAGADVSDDYPEGVIGMNQQIDSLQELKGMIKAYIKIL